MAVLRVIPRIEFDRLQALLVKKTGHGACVLMPDDLARELGVEDSQVFRYDFGGEADCWVDLVDNRDHLFVGQLRPPADEEDELVYYELRKPS